MVCHPRRFDHGRVRCAEGSNGHGEGTDGRWPGSAPAIEFLLWEMNEADSDDPAQQKRWRRYRSCASKFTDPSVVPGTSSQMPIQLDEEVEESDGGGDVGQMEDGQEVQVVQMEEGDGGGDAVQMEDDQEVQVVQMEHGEQEQGPGGVTNPIDLEEYVMPPRRSRRILLAVNHARPLAFRGWPLRSVGQARVARVLSASRTWPDQADQSRAAERGGRTCSRALVARSCAECVASGVASRVVRELVAVCVRAAAYIRPCLLAV